MSTTCSIYGLGLQVNVPIAGLAGLAAARNIDVLISLGSLPRDLGPLSEATMCHVSSEQDEHGEPDRTMSRLPESGYFRFDYSDGTVIVVDDEGSRVWATWPETASVEDTAIYLLGPILGFVLRLRGVTCLHASAIAVDGRAIALLGPAGAGKSSTAAAFARLGYPVLTDDVAAIVDHGDNFEVQPAYPRLRLWPESVQSLFGSVEALPRIVPNWDKRYLDLNSPGYRFQHKPLPLAAIYSLDERSTGPAMPGIEPVESRAGLMTLVANTYGGYLIDKPRRAAEFELLGRLDRITPLRRVRPSANFSRIPELCEAIVHDFRQLAACTNCPADVSTVDHV